MFINAEQRLNEALKQHLQSGEVVQQSAFGMHTVSRTTSKFMWLALIVLLILGFFTAMVSWIGIAILLACWNTKIFLVLTDRRLLIIELTNRLKVTGCKSFAIDHISDVDYTPGKWHELQLNANDQFIRCFFSSIVVHFENNGKRIEFIAQQLKELPAVRLMERFNGDNNFTPTVETVQGETIGNPTFESQEEAQTTQKVRQPSKLKPWLIAASLVLLMPVFVVVGFFMICFGIGISEGLKANNAEQQAQVAVENQDFEQAEEQFRIFIEATYTENKASGYQQLAEMWANANQLKKAEAVYQEGIAELENEDVSTLKHGLALVRAKLNTQQASAK